jgi:hypothetical protein
LLWVAAACGPSLDAGNSDVRAAFSSHRQYFEATVTGVVARPIPDEAGVSPHQRFIVDLDGGGSVEVVVNLDIVQRIPVVPGDRVTVRGEYVWNPEGGLLHWVHHDPSARHAAGYVEVNGTTYSLVLRPARDASGWLRQPRTDRSRGRFDSPSKAAI